MDIIFTLLFLVIGYIIVTYFYEHSDSKPRIRKSKRAKPKRYGVQSFTKNGNTVKSYSEKRIADYFTDNNIQYEYEKDIHGVYAYPDFYLPEYDVYVEYWGLVDADDPNLKYRYERSMKRKMARYHKNNIKFISLYPRNLENLDWVFRKKFERVTGAKLRDINKTSFCPSCGKRIQYQLGNYCISCGSILHA